MSWRLIIDADLSGHENMARDAAIAAALEAGSGRPTLRLYGWDRPTISVGYLQDPAPFLGAGLPVVRRITGGRAVLHWHEVTYSVAGAMADPLFSGGIHGAYSVISECIAAALRDSGVAAELHRGSSGRARSPACFHSPSRFEVLALGRKIVGSAQRRFRGSFLQHGSILMAPDMELNERVFGKLVSGRAASVAEFSQTSAGELKRLLVARFEQGFGARLDRSALTAGELEAAKGLLGFCLVSGGEPSGLAQPVVSTGF